MNIAYFDVKVTLTDSFVVSRVSSFLPCNDSLTPSTQRLWASASTHAALVSRDDIKREKKEEL